MSMSARCPKCGLTQLARDVCKKCGAPMPGAAPARAQRGAATAAPRAAPQPAAGTWTTRSRATGSCCASSTSRSTPSTRCGTSSGQPILFVERPAHLARNLGATLAGLVGRRAVLAALLPRACASLFGAQPAADGAAGALRGARDRRLPAPWWWWWRPHSRAKRHITFYRDPSKGERLLEVLQEEKLAFLVQHFARARPRRPAAGPLHQELPLGHPAEALAVRRPRRLAASAWPRRSSGTRSSRARSGSSSR